MRNLKEHIMENLDEKWTPYLADAFLSYNMNFKIPALAKKEELAVFNSPVMLVGAEGDYSFPGNKIIERGKEIFRNLKSAEVISGSKHSPPTTEEFRREMSGKIHNFLMS
jgi:hypothetical protein